METAHTANHNFNFNCQDVFLLFCSFLPNFRFSFLRHLSLTMSSHISMLSPLPLFFLSVQSNSLLPESLRNSDKRRNGPDFSNDPKKRKVDDKDSSHYVRNSFYFGVSYFDFKLGTKVYDFYLCLTG